MKTIAIAALLASASLAQAAPTNESATTKDAPPACCTNGAGPTDVIKSAGVSAASMKATLMNAAFKQCIDNCSFGKGAASGADNDDHIFMMKSMKTGMMKGMMKNSPDGPDGPGGFMRSMMSRHGDEAAGADRPRLGVALTLVNGDDGLAIRSVMDGFPADKAGLRKGDVITSVNGETPVTTEALQKALNAGRITLGIERGGDTRQVTIKLDDDRHQGMMGGGMGKGMGARGGHGEHADRHGFTIDQRLNSDIRAKLHALHEKLGKMRSGVSPRGHDFTAKRNHLLGALKDLGVNGEIIIKLRVDDDEAHSANKDMDFDFNFELDDDGMAKISKVLSYAMQAIGAELDENAQGAKSKAMDRPGHMRPSATRGHARDNDREAVEEAGERGHHARMKIERLRDDRARGNAARPHMRARMDQRQDRYERASGHRNPDADARFKSLEKRMERIEQLLQQLLQQG